VFGSDGEPHARSADVFSLGCVFIEIFTVLALRPVEEFVDFVNDEDDLLYINLEMVYCWIDEIASNVDEGARRFLHYTIQMVNERAERRPTAKDVWMATREARNDEEDILCGSCCQQTDQISQEIGASDHLFSRYNTFSVLAQFMLWTGFLGVNLVKPDR